MDLIREYELVITAETDLKKEAANAVQTKNFFKENSLLYIPEVYENFSSKNVMTMEKISGIPVTDIEVLKKENINLKTNRLAKKQLTWFKQEDRIKIIETNDAFIIKDELERIIDEK